MVEALGAVSAASGSSPAWFGPAVKLHQPVQPVNRQPTAQHPAVLHALHCHSFPVFPLG